MPAQRRVKGRGEAFFSFWQRLRKILDGEVCGTFVFPFIGKAVVWVESMRYELIPDAEYFDLPFVADLAVLTRDRPAAAAAIAIGTETAA